MSADPSNDPKRSDDRETEKRLRVEYGLDDPPRNPLSTAAFAGVEFAGVVVVLVALGWWLDRYFGTSPWILLGLTLLGMAAGVYRMIVKVLRAGEKG
jgi:ATP synthase protein I